MKHAVILVATVLAAGSCAPADIAANPQLVVINAILIAGQPAQSISILWGPTPQTPTVIGGPSADDVRLWIVAPNGDSTAVAPTGTSGAFTADLSPIAGATYRLTGTVSGVGIAASTTLPSSLVVNSPHNGDTAQGVPSGDLLRPTNIAIWFDTHSLGSGETIISIAFNNAAVGSTGSLVVVNGAVSDSLRFTVDTGMKQVRFRFTALDVNAALFALNRTETTTIQGALGVFGSALIDSVAVTIVPPE